MQRFSRTPLRSNLSREDIRNLSPLWTKLTSATVDALPFPKLFVPYLTARNLSSTPPSRNQDQLPRTKASTLRARRFLPGEEKHELPVNSLGGSSQVFVLTDAAQTSKQRKLEAARSKPAVKRGVKDGPSPADLLNSTKHERQLLGEGEIRDNLEDLRRTFSAIGNEDGELTREHYNQAKEALRSGFAHYQLTAYLRSFHITAEADKFNVLRPQSSSLYKRTAWTPGVSVFPDTALARLESTNERKTYVKVPDDAPYRPSQSSKDRTIDTILDRCWNLRIDEELGTPGELDLKISSDVRDLFFRLHGDGDGSLFARIANEYGARVDASRSAGLLRITASYQSCQRTLRLIDFTLEHRTDTFEISLGNAGDGVLMPMIPAAQLERIWANIGRNTNTKITATRSNEQAFTLKFDVWSVGPSKSDFIKVQRLVARAIDHLKEQAIPLFHPVLEANSLQATEIGDAESLPWVEDEPLIRWRLPEPFSKVPRAQAGHQTGNEGGLDVPVDTKTRLRSLSKSFCNELIISDPVQQERSWAKLLPGSDGPGTQEQFSISATFGLLGFPNPRQSHGTARSSSARHEQEAVAAFEKSNVKGRRLVSGNANLIGLALQFKDLHTSSLDQLKVRLIPSINDANVLRAGPPHVEFGVRFDRDAGTSKLNRIKLSSGFKFADLMMPELQTDARLHSYRATYQHEVTEFAWHSIIRKFIADYKLDVWGSDTACVPPEIVLGLPTSPASNGAGSEIPVRYHIVGLDYRSQFRFNYAGIKMVYSRIEPSSLEGRRDELMVEVSQPISMPVETRKRGFEAFYNTIITLAHSIRCADYLSQPLDEKLGRVSDKVKAEQLLLDLMRSAAARIAPTEGDVDAGQRPKSKIRDEIRLLLGSKGSVSQRK